MKYFYKDINTKKIHWTRGAFQDWQRGGILGAWHATFVTPRGCIFVPRYLLLPETIAALPTPPDAMDAGDVATGGK